MEFPVDCTCGARTMVREGLAGTRRTCACGRVFTVPPLHELRRQIGLPPYDISPELLIEHLLFNRELPRDRACIGCGAEVAQPLVVETQCERLQVRESGGAWWPFLFFGWIGLIALLQRKERQEYGKNKNYALPLAVCNACRRGLRGTREIKEMMRKVPEYERLLDKFPNATVRWG